MLPIFDLLILNFSLAAATLSSADSLCKHFGPRSGPVGSDLDPTRSTS